MKKQAAGSEKAFFSKSRTSCNIQVKSNRLHFAFQKKAALNGGRRKVPASAAVAEKTKQVQEDVDKIKIKLQGADDRVLFPGLRFNLPVTDSKRKPLDLLRVVCGQDHENRQSDVTDDQVNFRAVPDHVEQRGDNHPQQPHQRQIADRGQIAPGQVTVKESGLITCLPRNQLS